MEKKYFIDITTGAKAVLSIRANGTALLKTEYETNDEEHTVWTNYDSEAEAFDAWEQLVCSVSGKGAKI